MTWPLSIFSFVFVSSTLLWVPSACGWSTLQQQSFLRPNRRQCSCSQNENVLSCQLSLCTLNDSIQARRRRIPELCANTNDEIGEDEDDDDEPPEVDIRNFRYNGINVVGGNDSSPASFGLGRGRSSPSQRKAMGTSSKTSTTVYVCSSCGSESVQWRGRCPTCKKWNCFEEVRVQRSSSTLSSQGPVGGAAHNLFEGRNRIQNVGQQHASRWSNNKLEGQSWLDGVSPESSDFFVHYDDTSNLPVSISDIDLKAPQSERLIIPGDDEMNEVLGGGLMKGSLILLGGDPGVGKSTLALQMATQVASLSTAPDGIGMGLSSTRSDAIGPVWYVSGEETLEQIAIRAQRFVASDVKDDFSMSISAINRLDSLPKQLFLLSETNVNVLADRVIQTWIDNKNTILREDLDPLDSSALETQFHQLPPSLILIDSIQTMVCEAGGSSSAGGISQVRECMTLLLRLAKTTQIPILTIGHVTKTGDVAGPRMVEHMVDAVLYLEHSISSVASSPSNGHFRWLRAQKNRFGSCQSVGLYNFQDGILVPLPEGTESALAPPTEDLEGCAMGICVEGTHRAMTVEVQALVTIASNSYGKKTVEGGLSSARLNLLLGILHKHCQLPIAGGGKISRDVYVNIVGCDGTVSKSQLALATMALDLAVAVALTSSYLRIPTRGDTICLAHVGLLGELRPLSSLESRLLQAQRMGFSRVIIASTHNASSSRRPKRMKKNQSQSSSHRQNSNDEEFQTITKRKFGLDVFECSTLKQALDLALTFPLPASPKKFDRQQSKSSDSMADNSINFKLKEFKTSPPGSLNDLNLADEVILDDEDDEYDVF